MSADDKSVTTLENLEAVGLESPAKITPSVRKQSHPEELPALPPREVTPIPVPEKKIDSTPPALPPRDHVVQVSSPPLTVVTKDDNPPELPARSPRSPHSPRSPRSPRSHKSSRNDNEKAHHTRQALAKSLVYHDPAHYLVVNHASSMARYKQFLKDQELLKEQSIDEMFSELESTGTTTIDFEFWKVFLSNYEEISSSTDLTLLQKIEVEMSNLSDPQLRKIVHLVLTHSNIFDDELFNGLEIDLTSEQKAFIENLGGSDDLTLLLSKFITVDGGIPNQFIVELARISMDLPFFEAIDVFKLTTCYNYQFQKFVAADKEKETNTIFLFQFARAMEDTCPKVLLLLTKSSTSNDTLSSLKQILNNSELWVAFFKNLKDNVTVLKLLDSFILKGFETLIILMVKLINRDEVNAIKALVDENFDGFVKRVTSPEFFEPLNTLEFYSSKEPIHLYKYREEFKIIVKNSSIMFPEKSTEKLHKATTTNQKLLALKEQLDTKYNQILSNYQQLNEEKFTNQTYLKPLLQKKTELVNRSRALLADYEMKSKNVEILRINNERNEEIDKSNEALTDHIRQLNEEVEELRVKIKQLKESKGKK